ncbi:hypothetical protein [Halomonas sp.]|uniref:hypothetical protein n=1 Tax=Halomonas sp. TaxID=1486246 RepID=UPI0035615FCA
MENQLFTVESLKTGERRTVTAPDWMQALKDQPDTCFLLTLRHDGRYAAMTVEKDDFPMTAEYIAATPEAAADKVRQMHRDVKRARHRNQTPIHAPQYCVMYLKDGKEKRGAWMNRERAHQAAAMMRAKYGERNVTVYMD